MADQLQLRGGTTTEHNTFTGASKEVTIDTTKKTAVVHDGVTAGGNPLMREDGANSALALGSQGTPSLKFTGDTNTGIYSPGADQVAISTNGTGRLFVDASGNVGINRSVPQSGLDIRPGVTGTLNAITMGYGRTANPTDAIHKIRWASDDLIIEADSANTIASNIRFYNDGTEKMVLDSSGRLGVGTSSPGATLHSNAALNQILASDSVTSDKLYISVDNGVADINTYLSGTGRMPLRFMQYASEVARFDSSGRLGLGTSSPGELLTVAGATNPAISIVDTTNNTDARIRTNDNGDLILEADVNQEGTSSRMAFRVDADEKMCILSTGNVGIGVTNPTFTNGDGLRIQREGTACLRLDDNTNSKAGEIYADSTGLNLDARGTSAVLNFDIGGSTKATLDNSGRLLVGTSSGRSNIAGTAQDVVIERANIVSQSLVANQNASGGSTLSLCLSRGTAVGSNTIVQSGDIVGTLAFRGNDGTNFLSLGSIKAEVDGTPGANDMPGRLVFSTTADGASSPTERMRITNGGQVLIGTTDGGSSSDSGIVLGTAGSSIWKADGTGDLNQLDFYRGTSGSYAQVGKIVTNSTGTSFTSVSDYRLKENVTAVTDGIKRLQQLKPSRFNFITDPDKTVDGFLAHEVQTIVPEAITGEKDAVDDDGNPVYQGIDQSKLVPLLTAALQEAVAKIESLEARLTAADL